MIIMVNITYDDVFNVYIKWKNIVYYSNNNLLYKKKIVDFENSKKIISTIENIKDYLIDPDSESSKEYLAKLLKKINFFVIPKSVTFNNAELITSNEDKNGKLESVNFFIDAPIDIYVIDLFITIDLGFIAYQNQHLLDNVSFGNSLKTFSLYSNNEINLKGKETFKIYFHQYQKWRNNAFDKAENILSNKDEQNNVVILNYDIKSFYYNAAINFDNIFERNSYFVGYKYIDFLKSVYGTYTKKLHRYKTKIYKHKNNEYMLPIGLESSKLLSDLYLLDYDLISTKTSFGDDSIEYYGRYVDDILIVFKTKEEFKNKEECISYVNSKLDLFSIEKKEEEITYYIKNYSNLEIQPKKMDVYFFKNDEEEKNKYMHVYGAKMRMQASNVGDFFDDTFVDKNYIDYIYKNDKGAHFSKFSDIKTSKIDKLALSIYLSKAISLYKSTSYTEKDVKQILSLINNELSYLNLIDNFKSLEKIFNLLAIFKFEQFYDYFKKQKDFILNELDLTNISDIKNKKTIFNRIKKNLITSLEVAASLSACVDTTRNYHNIRNLVKYRKSLMFEKRLIAMPLSQFHNYKGKNNFMDAAIVSTMFNYEFDNELFKFCPYRITLPEYELYCSLKGIINNEQINHNSIFDEYWRLVGLNYDELPVEKHNYRYKHNNHDEYLQQEEVNENIICISIKDEQSFKDYEKIRYSELGEKEQIIDEIKESHFPIENMGISIASLPLSKINILTPIKNKTSYKNLKYKRQIYKVLNDSKKNKTTKFIVFPELSIPLDWVSDLIFYSKKNKISIVFGMYYVFHKINSGKYQARNIAATINYYKDMGTYDYSKVILREKNNYPYEEKETLKQYDCVCFDALKPFYYIIKFKGICYSFVVCYELTDIRMRSLLKGYIDNLFVPVFNKDTNYFSNVVDATARDLYCYVSMANTSKYGDSRITAPFDTNNKDIVRIKGGVNSFCTIGKVEIKDLHEHIIMNDQINHNRFLQKNRKKLKPNDKFKPLPAGNKEYDFIKDEVGKTVEYD